jgi:hypothetical protein
MFDPIFMMHIRFAAACMANDQNPDYEGRLIDIITDDHYRAALKDYFSEDPDWTDDLLPRALEKFKESEEIEERLQGFCRDLLGSVMRGCI